MDSDELKRILQTVQANEIDMFAVEDNFTSNVDLETKFCKSIGDEIEGSDLKR